MSFIVLSTLWLIASLAVIWSLRMYLPCFVVRWSDNLPPKEKTIQPLLFHPFKELVSVSLTDTYTVMSLILNTFNPYLLPSISHSSSSISILPSLSISSLTPLTSLLLCFFFTPLPFLLSASSLLPIPYLLSPLSTPFL